MSPDSSGATAIATPALIASEIAARVAGASRAIRHCDPAVLAPPRGGETSGSPDGSTFTLGKFREFNISTPSIERFPGHGPSAGNRALLSRRPRAAPKRRKSTSGRVTTLNSTPEL
jgi:hypothetical protein